MKKSSGVFLLLSLCFVMPRAFSAEEAPGIAKVSLDKLKGLVLERVFAKAVNSHLKKLYEEQELKRKEAHEKMQKAMKSGKFNPMEFAGEFSPYNMEDQKKIDELVRAELILIIEEVFPKRYKLVLNDGYSVSILYTDIVIPDITPNLKQYLLKKKATG